LYVPGLKKGSEYTPSALVSVERLTPVFVSVTFTTAPGTDAPEESVTVPVRVADTTCAKQTGVKSSVTATVRNA
jgi:hypothetical protein